MRYIQRNLRVLHITLVHSHPLKCHVTLSICGKSWYSEGSSSLWKGTRWSIKTKQTIGILVQFLAWLINGIQTLYPAQSSCAKYCRKDVEEHGWILKSLQEGGKQRHSSNQAKQHFFFLTKSSREEGMLTYMNGVVSPHWPADSVETCASCHCCKRHAGFFQHRYLGELSKSQQKMGPKTEMLSFSFWKSQLPKVQQEQLSSWDVGIAGARQNLEAKQTLF